MLLLFALATVTAQAEPGCRPLRYFRYAIPAGVPLPCTPGTVKLFDRAMTARGLAFARVTSQFTNKGWTQGFWNVTVATGQPAYAYGIGDDLCPGASSLYKINVGIGRLADGADHVSVLGMSGATVCSGGAIQSLPGAFVEIWVADPRPECEKAQIQWRSWYQLHGTQVAYWAGYLSPLLAMPLTAREPSSAFRIMSLVEGTPNPVGYTCAGVGSPSTLWLRARYGTELLTTRQWAIPPSAGMGHLVLWTDDIVRPKPADLGRPVLAWMDIARSLSSPTTTGGCCGDGALFALDVTRQIDCSGANEKLPACRQ